MKSSLTPVASSPSCTRWAQAGRREQAVRKAGEHSEWDAMQDEAGGWLSAGHTSASRVAAGHGDVHVQQGLLTAARDQICGVTERPSAEAIDDRAANERQRWAPVHAIVGARDGDAARPRVVERKGGKESASNGRVRLHQKEVNVSVVRVASQVNLAERSPSARRQLRANRLAHLDRTVAPNGRIRARKEQPLPSMVDE